MISLVFLLFMALTVYAGTETGNGGDVLVCPDRIELLDFYEAGLHDEQILSMTGSDEWVIAAKILERVAGHNPTRSRVYLEGLKTFQAEIDFITDQELPDIPDQGDIPLPRNCELKQIVIQTPPKVQDTYSSWGEVQPKRYKIDLNLWVKLSPMQKAGLITHELLLREAIHSLKHTNSKQVRRINAFWWKEQFPDKKSNLYNITMKLHGFFYVDLTFGDFTIFSKANDYQTIFEDGEMLYMVISAGNSISWYKEQQVIVKYLKLSVTYSVVEAFISNTGNPLKVSKKELPFYGAIQFQGDKITATAKRPISVEWENGRSHAYGRITIDSRGTFLIGQLAEPLQMRALTYNLILNADSLVHLHSDGTLKFSSSARGAAKGESPTDYFILQDAQLFIDPLTKEVRNIKGSFRGHIQTNCSPLPLQAEEQVSYGSYGYGETFLKRLAAPVSCTGSDGQTYQVLNDIIFRTCYILGAREIPQDALPCRWNK